MHPRQPTTAIAAEDCVLLDYEVRMDQTRPSASACTGFLSSRYTVLPLLIATLSGFALGQKQKGPQFGAECQALKPGAEGYPADFVLVPGGVVRLGIDHKDALDISKLYSYRDKKRRATYLKRIKRELGKQELLLPSFLVGRHEVTNEQYHAFIKKNLPKFRFPFDWWTKADIRRAREAWFKLPAEQRKGKNFVPLEHWRQNFPKLKFEIPKGKEKEPVSFVSYRDAREYCKWAGVRMVYEAEYQYLLQGNTAKPKRYLWGDKWDNDKAKEVFHQKSIRDQKKKPAGARPNCRSQFGVDDLIGNVWEWTDSSYALFDGYKKESKSLERAWKKVLGRKYQMLPEPVPDASKRVIRGGSFNSVGEAGFAFRNNTRYALSTEQTIEDLGFRIAKSIAPALDGTALRARLDFEVKNIDDLELDVPSARETRNAKGLSRRYEQRGIERWDFKGEIITRYQMISFVPIRELKYRAEKDLRTASRENASEGKHGLPVVALFTDSGFSVQQGLKQWIDLNPGMYTIRYRDKGSSRAFEVALARAKAEIKAAKAKAKNKKDDKKKTKKSSKKKGKQDDKDSAGDWKKTLELYGWTVDDLAALPRGKKPETITIQPGNLKIPLKKSVLLFRNNAGEYVGWAEYRPAVRRANATNAKVQLKIDEAKGTLEYVGGPRTARASHRFEFKVSIKLPDGELRKNWITEASLVPSKAKPPEKGNITEKPGNTTNGK